MAFDRFRAVAVPPWWYPFVVTLVLWAVLMATLVRMRVAHARAETPAAIAGGAR